LNFASIFLFVIVILILLDEIALDRLHLRIRHRLAEWIFLAHESFDCLRQSRNAERAWSVLKTASAVMITADDRHHMQVAPMTNGSKKVK
jgi:hypothetical protein